MTHDELLAKIDAREERLNDYDWNIDLTGLIKSIRAVVELHKEHIGGFDSALYCFDCGFPYPCLTIQAIEKELG